MFRVGGNLSFYCTISIIQYLDSVVFLICKHPRFKIFYGVSTFFFQRFWFSVVLQIQEDAAIEINANNNVGIEAHVAENNQQAVYPMGGEHDLANQNADDDGHDDAWSDGRGAVDGQ